MTQPNLDLFCAKCSRVLTPGSGEFYEVTIEAVADPTPPTLDATDLPIQDLERDFNSLVREMEHLSAREAMDQIHRKMTIHFCTPCYRIWIEDPGAGAE